MNIKESNFFKSLSANSHLVVIDENKVDEHGEMKLKSELQNDTIGHIARVYVLIQMRRMVCHFLYVYPNAMEAATILPNDQKLYCESWEVYAHC